MRLGKVSWGEVYSKGAVLGRCNSIMLCAAFNLENGDLVVRPTYGQILALLSCHSRSWLGHFLRQNGIMRFDGRIKSESMYQGPDRALGT